MIRDYFQRYVRASAKVLDIAILLLRFELGWSFFANGSRKLSSIASTTEFFRSLGVPFADQSTVLAARTEQIGGFLLAFGLLTRFTSPALAFVMIIATAYAHWSDIHGLSDLSLAAPTLPFVACVYFAVAGGGRWSLDHAVDFAIRFRGDASRLRTTSTAA